MYEMTFRPISGERTGLQPDARHLEILFFTISPEGVRYHPYWVSEHGKNINVEVEDSIPRDKVIADLRKHCYVPV